MMKMGQGLRLKAICFCLAVLLFMQGASPYRPQASLRVQAAAAQASPDTISVMTFNIQHGEGLDGKVDLDRIIDLIRTAEPDVAALQEVDRFRLRSGYIDQAEELAARLGMAMCFSPSVKYGAALGEYGNVVLSRFPISRCEFVKLPGIKEDRTLLRAKLDIGNNDLSFVSLHLGVSYEERGPQIARASAYLSSLEGAVIVGGDFNMEAPIGGSPFFRDSLLNVPLVPGEATYGASRVIDLLFTNLANHLSPGSAWTIPTDSSDHLPVMARVRIGSGARV